MPSKNAHTVTESFAELLTLRDEARRLQARAEAKGDVRTALGAIRELTRLVELKARVMGEIRDREINITNVQIDPATAEKMAVIFLARRRAAALSSGTRPVEVSQTAAKGEE